MTPPDAIARLQEQVFLLHYGQPRHDKGAPGLKGVPGLSCRACEEILSVIFALEDDKAELRQMLDADRALFAELIEWASGITPIDDEDADMWRRVAEEAKRG